MKEKKELIIEEEKVKLKCDIKKIFTVIQSQTESIPKKLNDQVDSLFILHSEIYEDLNQLQHKSLIIVAAEILEKKFIEINRWCWHPEQTSDPDEADLTGYQDKKVIINAEVTTSNNPMGGIDTRMRKTLKSLSTKEGKRFYFVQTEKMFNRAKTKITNNNWNITPHKIK